MSRYTVSDVAKRAGVSIATVSRALGAKSGSVAAETRERVVEAARSLGFRPDRIAQGLRLGQGHSVALVLGDIEVGIYGALIERMQGMLSELGLDLLLYNLGHSEDRLEAFLQGAPAMRLRGIAIAVTDEIPPARFAPLLQRLIEQGIAIVSVGQRMEAMGVPSIVHEERRAAEIATRLLISRSEGPVAFLGSVAGSAIGVEREQGYRLALAAAGRSTEPDLVWDTSVHRQRAASRPQLSGAAAGYEAVAAALSAGRRFNAILASTNRLAVGAMAAIYDYGLRVPGDVAIVAFGDVEWTPYLRPALSALTSSWEEVAEHVRRLLVEGEAGAAPMLVTLERRLVARGST